jgi:hypothetical protein
MSIPSEVEQYVKNPELLIDLCRSVVVQLKSGVESDQIGPMNAQLREIATAIEKLEKQNVMVPEPLRAEKTRIAAALTMQTDASEELRQFGVGLESMLAEIKLIIGKATSNRGSKPGKKRSMTPKTPSSTLRQLIIESLGELGGSARKNDVLGLIEKKLEGELLPGDMEWRNATNDYAWQNNACWERYRMAQENILKTGSPRGTWELSEE